MDFASYCVDGIPTRFWSSALLRELGLALLGISRQVYVILVSLGMAANGSLSAKKRHRRTHLR